MAWRRAETILTIECPLCDAQLRVPLRVEGCVIVCGQMMFRIERDMFDVDAHMLTHDSTRVG